MSEFESQQLPRQQGQVTEMKNNAPMSGPGRDESSARKKAKYAEMEFRISKGYEKDNLWTKVKYFFKER